uniref:TM2 domain-containing protein n=1 Tax=Syphacia muris TaxID=451379 RepID=A0A0N5ASJ8_9BILA
LKLVDYYSHLLLLLICFCSESSCVENGSCLDCVFPKCNYGETVSVNCTTNSLCKVRTTIQKQARCRYCWQLDSTEYQCNPVKNCSITATHLFRTLCSVYPSVICIGRRIFYKRERCNWSSGHVWWKAMLYSIILGGFGADRFYLGLWKSAFGKLFSFGGLGIWTVVDVILIGVGYVGPADGSVYI